MYHCRGMNSGGVLGGRMEQSYRSRECQIRILAAQHCRREGREVLGNDDGRRVRPPGSRRILWVGHKRKLARAGFFNSSHARDLGIGRAIFQTRAQRRSNLCKFHLSVRKSETVIVIEAQPERKRIRTTAGMRTRTTPLTGTAPPSW